MFASPTASASTRTRTERGPRGHGPSCTVAVAQASSAELLGIHTGSEQPGRCMGRTSALPGGAGHLCLQKGHQAPLRRQAPVLAEDDCHEPLRQRDHSFPRQQAGTEARGERRRPSEDGGGETGRPWHTGGPLRPSLPASALQREGAGPDTAVGGMGTPMRKRGGLSAPRLRSGPRKDKQLGRAECACTRLTLLKQPPPTGPMPLLARCQADMTAGMAAGGLLRHVDSGRGVRPMSRDPAPASSPRALRPCQLLCPPRGLRPGPPRALSKNQP